MLRWVCNTGDPNAPGVRFDPRESYDWLRDKIIGRPKASRKHTVEELEAMGLVGLYVEAEDEQV